MTSKEYLWQLRALLTGNMKTQELERTMEYYTDLFRDDPRPEAEVIAELGTPEELASSLLGYDAAAQRAAKDPSYVYAPDAPQGMPLAGRVTIAILCFPLILAGLATCFSLVAALGAMAVAFLAAGVTMVIGGISAVLQSGATTILWCGGGIAFLGLGILFVPATIGLGKVFGRCAGRFFRWLTRA